MGDEFGILVAKYGILSGAAAYIASLAIKKWASTKEQVSDSGARSSVINLLSDRVTALETAVTNAQHSFDMERAARIEAEAQVAKLLIRVAALEAQLLRLGHTPD